MKRVHNATAYMRIGHGLRGFVVKVTDQRPLSAVSEGAKANGVGTIGGLDDHAGVLFVEGVRAKVLACQLSQAVEVVQDTLIVISLDVPDNCHAAICKGDASRFHMRYLRKSCQ